MSFSLSTWRASPSIGQGKGWGADEWRRAIAAVKAADVETGTTTALRRVLLRRACRALGIARHL